MYNLPTNIVFDLDGTLVDDNYKLFPDVKDIIDYLLDNNHTIYIASFNEDAKHILEIINGIDNDVVKKYVVGYDDGKRMTKDKFLDELNLPKDDTIFFDDEIKNINDCKNKGWMTKKVYELTWNDLKL